MYVKVRGLTTLNEKGRRPGDTMRAQWTRHRKGMNNYFEEFIRRIHLRQVILEVGRNMQLATQTRSNPIYALKRVPIGRVLRDTLYSTDQTDIKRSQVTLGITLRPKEEVEVCILHSPS